MLYLECSKHNPISLFKGQVRFGIEGDKLWIVDGDWRQIQDGWEIDTKGYWFMDQWISEDSIFHFNWVPEGWKLRYLRKDIYPIPFNLSDTTFSKGDLLSFELEQLRRFQSFEELYPEDDSIETDYEHLNHWVQNSFGPTNYSLELGGPQRRLIVYVRNVADDSGVNTKRITTLEEFVQKCVLRNVVPEVGQFSSLILSFF